MWIKDCWKKQDINDFDEYLLCLQNKDRILWTTKIINTKQKVLAIKTQTLKNIAKEISKGNYLSLTCL